MFILGQQYVNNSHYWYISNTVFIFYRMEISGLFVTNCFYDAPSGADPAGEGKWEKEKKGQEWSQIATGTRPKLFIFLIKEKHVSFLYPESTTLLSHSVLHYPISAR